MSPSVLEVALRAYYSPEPFDLTYPAARNAIETLEGAGIIEPDAERGRNCYKTTERGTAWVRMLLSTPYPVQQWADPRKAQEGGPR